MAKYGIGVSVLRKEDGRFLHGRGQYVADLRLAAPERDGVTLSDMATAVRALPTGQRAAFVLRKVEGRSYAEVADALGCSEEAARSRVAEAMKKVKEAVR